MGSRAPNQAQKEGQIAETVVDDAGPCASCALTLVCSSGHARYAPGAHTLGKSEGWSQPLESRNSFRFLSGSMSSILVVQLGQSLLWAGLAEEESSGFEESERR